MIDAMILDHMGQQHVIRSAADVNRLLEAIERRRDQLADLMLGPDRGAAIKAEQESDRLEDVYLPGLQREVERVRALLEADAGDEHRRAKARAIKARVTEARS